jgi:hypothetical protein
MHSPSSCTLRDRGLEALHGGCPARGRMSPFTVSRSSSTLYCERRQMHRSLTASTVAPAESTPIRPVQVDGEKHEPHSTARGGAETRATDLTFELFIFVLKVGPQVSDHAVPSTYAVRPCLVGKMHRASATLCRDVQNRRFDRAGASGHGQETARVGTHLDGMLHHTMSF